MVTCWERAELLALLFVVFSCAFVTFQFGVLGQAWYLIVSIPDLCILSYFVEPDCILRVWISCFELCNKIQCAYNPMPVLFGLVLNDASTLVGHWRQTVLK